MASIASRSKESRVWIWLTIILILVIALLASLIWGLDREQRRAQREAQLAGLLAQSYYELVDHVDNLSNDLTKLMVSASPGVNAQLLARVSAQAQSAADNVASLPGGHSALEGTMSFLNQAGDLARSLMRKTGTGHPLSGSDLTQLNSLNESCIAVLDRLAQVDPTILTHGEDGDYYEGSGQEEPFSQALYGGENSVEYPSLIYDGPFSDSMRGLPAKALSGMHTVDEETALQLAARALWVEPSQLMHVVVESGQIEAYLFEGDIEGTHFAAAMTVQGGQLLWILADRAVGEPSMLLEEANRLAASAVERWGFGPMRISWSQMSNGIATVSLIPVLGEAGVYPDMIKVKVAMDNGQILGMDASAWWMNHTRREFAPVTITREEAEGLISPQLQAQKVQLAVIPTEGGAEKLCWEVEACFGDARFFVYLDGQTGQEIQIFRVVETNEGLMTMER